MNIKIDIQNFEKKKLSLAPSGKNTAWSYFNVYSLRDFRDIYNVIYKNSNVRSLSSLLSYCNELRIKSESGKAWSERNLVTTQVGLSYSPMHNFPRCNQRE